MLPLSYIAFKSAKACLISFDVYEPSNIASIEANDEYAIKNPSFQQI